MSGRFPASPKRIREARAQGNVAYSPLLTAGAALLAGAIAIALTARASAERITQLARRAWLGQGGADDILPSLSAMLMPVALALLAAALVAGLAQTRGLFAWSALGRPRRDDGDALPLLAWAASLLLLLALSAPLSAILAGGARTTELRALAAATLTSLQSLAPRALVVIALAGLGDLAWRRARLMESLSMTRGERERERREDEGDPRLRAEQRRRQRALGRDPLVDDVARAQVVLLAEGLAVGLRQVDGRARIAASLAGESGAPTEGRLRAQRLVAIARRLGLPIRIDDTLTEALAALPSNTVVPELWQARALALLHATRRPS